MPFPVWLKALGPLRAALIAMVALLVLARPFATLPPAHDSVAELLATIVIPVLVPMVAMVLLFDVLMTAVFRSDAHGDERQRLGRCLSADALAVAAVLAVWGPYFAGFTGA